MLDFEKTMELIQKSKSGDNAAKEVLLENNAPLLKSLIRRFKGKNVEYEDLYQLACVGFLKAINNFDSSHGVQFSTYAVPMIVGEIKRFLRDDGTIKVSRSIKVLSMHINKFIAEYKLKHMDSPTTKRLAEHFKVDEGEIIFAMDSARLPVSLYEKADDSKDNSLQLIDKIPDENREDELIDKIDLLQVINTLDEREKKIILLRYYRDKTQGEIAELMGVSQVQISRLETKIIEKLRKSF